MPNREQRDLIIKVDEGLNDHFTDIPRAPTTLGVCPRRLNIAHVSYDALSFTRTAHNRLDNERYADRVGSLQVSFTGICEPVVRCLQTQLFRGKLPDPFRFIVNLVARAVGTTGTPLLRARPGYLSRSLRLRE